MYFYDNPNKKFVSLVFDNGDGHGRLLSIEKEKKKGIEKTIAGINHFLKWVEVSDSTGRAKTMVETAIFHLVLEVNTMNLNAEVINELRQGAENRTRALLNISNRLYSQLIENPEFINIVGKYILANMNSNFDALTDSDGFEDKETPKLHTVDALVSGMLSVFVKIFYVVSARLEKPNLSIIKILLNKIDAWVDDQGQFIVQESYYDRLITLIEYYVDKRKSKVEELVYKFKPLGSSVEHINFQIIEEFLCRSLYRFVPILDYDIEAENDKDRVAKLKAESLVLERQLTLQKAIIIHYDKYRFVDKNLSGYLQTVIDNKTQNLTKNKNPKSIVKTIKVGVDDDDGNSMNSRYETFLEKFDVEKYDDLKEIVDEIVNGLYRQLDDYGVSMIDEVTENIRDNKLANFIISDFIQITYNIDTIELFSYRELAIILLYLNKVLVLTPNIRMAMVSKVGPRHDRYLNMEPFKELNTYKAGGDLFLSSIEDILSYEYGVVKEEGIYNDLLNYLKLANNRGDEKHV